MKAPRLQLDLRAAIDRDIGYGWKIVQREPTIVLERNGSRKQVRNGCLIDG